MLKEMIKLRQQLIIESALLTLRDAEIINQSELSELNTIFKNKLKGK